MNDPKGQKCQRGQNGLVDHIGQNGRNGQFW